MLDSGSIGLHFSYSPSPGLSPPTADTHTHTHTETLSPVHHGLSGLSSTSIITHSLKSHFCIFLKKTHAHTRTHKHTHTSYTRFSSPMIAAHLLLPLNEKVHPNY